MRSSRVTAVASDEQAQSQRRLHPLSWLFALLAFMRQFVAPIIVALIFGARRDYELWGLLAAVPLLIGALWHQYFYRYGFGPRELVIREGILFRNLRRIDFARIVNIDTVRGPLHRLFNVAEVKIETSAGGKAEALIRVLGPQALQELRERVFGAQDAGATGVTDAQSEGEEAPTPLLHLPPGELVRFGLIDNRGVILAVAAAGTASQMGLDEVMGRALMESLPGAVDDVGSLAWPLQVALALVVILGALLLLRLLSIALALLTLYDFRLTRKGADLRAQYGLLTRVALTLRQQRIQAVRETETFLHRLLDRVSLQVDLAGDAQEGGEQQADRMRWLAPVTTPARAPQLIASALPQFDPAAQPDWQPLAAGARRRVFRRSAFVGSLLALLPSTWFLGYAGALVVLLTVPLAAFHARQYVRYTRWAMTPEVLLFRRGWLTRRLVIAPRNRVQSVELTESPFDRRHRMASVGIDAAGGSARAFLIRIPYLPVEVARELAHDLYRQIQEPLVSVAPSAAT